MEPEECLEMMKALRDAYKRVSGRADFSLEQVYDLKHVLPNITQTGSHTYLSAFVVSKFVSRVASRFQMIAPRIFQKHSRFRH